jgi:hypothetical protein
MLEAEFYARVIAFLSPSTLPMAGPLEWIFKLTDEMSGPAKKIAAQLDGVKASLRGVETAAVNPLGNVTRSAGATSRSFADVRRTVNDVAGELAFVGALASGAALAIGAIGVKFGSAVVEAASFKSAAQTSLELMLGNRDAAKSFLAELTKFADITPFETKTIVGAGKQLIGGGFNPEEVKTILRGVGDVAAANNFDTGTFGSIVTQLNQVRAIGKLAYEDLKQIGQASGGAVSLEKVYAAIAKDLGKSTDEAKRLVSTGGVDAQTGIAATLESIRTGASGGQLGGLTDKLSTSIPGLLSTLRSKFFDLVPSVEESPGLAAMQAALKGLVDLLDRANPMGARLRSAFDGLVNKSFGALFSGGGSEKLVAMLVDGVELLAAVVPSVVGAFRALGGGIIEGAGAALKPLMDVLRLSDPGGTAAAIATGVRFIGEAIGFTAAILAIGAGTIGLAIAGLGQAFQQLFDWGAQFVAFGTSIVDGLWTGVTNAWGGMIARFKGLVDLLPAAVKSVLGINSPARVMMPLGSFTAQGIGLGFQGEWGKVANDVQSSVGDLASPTFLTQATFAAPAAARSSGGGAAAGPTIVVNVDARGATVEAAHAIGESVGAAIEAALARAALSVGAAA